MPALFTWLSLAHSQDFQMFEVFGSKSYFQPYMIIYMFNLK